jgi:hypothetical protein
MQMESDMAAIASPAGMRRGRSTTNHETAAPATSFAVARSKVAVRSAVPREVKMPVGRRRLPRHGAWLTPDDEEREPDFVEGKG